MSIEDKALLLVRVAHWQGPFYLKSQGMPGGVYLRLGSTNRIAGPHQLEELKRTQSNISFDQLPCTSLGIKSLDMERIEKNFSHIVKKVNEVELETLGLLVRCGGNLVCSNGGIILFGINSIREQYFPNATIRCARFRG